MRTDGFLILVYIGQQMWIDELKLKECSIL